MIKTYAQLYKLNQKIYVKSDILMQILEYAMSIKSVMLVLVSYNLLKWLKPLYLC